MIGTEGRQENLGDIAESPLELWNSRIDSYWEEADCLIEIPHAEGGHGDADRFLVAELFRSQLRALPTTTSPIGAAIGGRGGQGHRVTAPRRGARRIPPLRSDVEAH